MERLWSPWRSEYIETLLELNEGCVFCQINELQKDEHSFIVLRRNHNFIVMNIYPYNSGHLLIVPYKHLEDPTALPDDTLFEAMKLIQSSITVLKNTFNAAGFNVGLNIGAVAGAGIHEHVHFHVVPRWKGDTNFMPVLGGTKVISQDLKESYSRIKSEFENLLAANS